MSRGRERDGEEVRVRDGRRRKQKREKKSIIFSPALPSPASPSSFLATSVALAQYSASYSSKSAVEGSPDDIFFSFPPDEDAAVSDGGASVEREALSLSLLRLFSLFLLTSPLHVRCRGLLS